MAIDHNDSGLASSLTDLMTSLAVIFILLLVAALNNAQQKGMATVTNILVDLQNALKGFIQQDKVEVSRDEKDPLGLLVVVPESLLGFQKDKSEIPAPGQRFLAKFLPVLAQTTCSDRFRSEIGSIVVEGHASSEGEEKHNLQLSQERSMAVVQQSLDILDKQQSPREKSQSLRSCFLDLLSATGRGSADPLPDASGQEDKGRTRRVQFKIRVKPSDLNDLNSSLTPAPVSKSPE
jgi:outer membrane protein OmpA-like peptidoglycan-associated protein